MSRRIQISVVDLTPSVGIAVAPLSAGSSDSGMGNTVCVPTVLAFSAGSSLGAVVPWFSAFTPSRPSGTVARNAAATLAA